MNAPLSRPLAWLDRVLWWLLPLVCHWGFSWIGFSPTDDGWLQAVARRLLDGEVPHRDFISVRPVLSAMLQMPLTALGGDHVIWLSRLWGWLFIGGICWLWTGIVGATGLTRHLLYCIAVLLTAHTFPVMAWHTLDGLLLCTFAVLCAMRGQRTAAFLLVGCAALCRQNFAFFAPLLLIAVGGRWTSWFTAGFWSALPAAIYWLAIAVAGGGRDFWTQVLATRGALFDTAVNSLLHHPWWLYGLLAGAAVAAIARFRPAHAWTVVPFSAAGLAYLLWHGPRLFQFGCFALFGLCLVTSLGRGDRMIRTSALGLAWVAMISLGYNNPALAAGILFALLWRLTSLPGATTATSPAGARLAIVAVATLTVAAGFVRARFVYPYRDAEVEFLRWDAGPVLPGAAGLRTNAVTAATLAELRELTLASEQRGARYAILTDVSAHWILSRQRNPLPCEWPQETEFGSDPALGNKILAALARLPANSDIFVQKYLISDYAAVLEPITTHWSYYQIQNWVKRHCRKKGEARYYDIYAPPEPAGTGRSSAP